LITSAPKIGHSILRRQEGPGQQKPRLRVKDFLIGPEKSGQSRHASFLRSILVALARENRNPRSRHGQAGIIPFSQRTRKEEEMRRLEACWAIHMLLRRDGARSIAVDKNRKYSDRLWQAWAQDFGQKAWPLSGKRTARGDLCCSLLGNRLRNAANPKVLPWPKVPKARAPRAGTVHRQSPESPVFLAAPPKVGGGELRQRANACSRGDTYVPSGNPAAKEITKSQSFTRETVARAGRFSVDSGQSQKVADDNKK